MALVRNRNYGGVGRPDYDSTKAALDELERRINTLMGSITALEAKVKEHVNSHVVIPQEFITPPPTCGNCGKAWRQDNGNYVRCGITFDELEFYPRCQEACPHYERREEA